VTRKKKEVIFYPLKIQLKKLKGAASILKVPPIGICVFFVVVVKDRWYFFYIVSKSTY